MMEERKTIFDYIGQIFFIFGVTVAIFIIFGYIIGTYASAVSTLFALGNEGIRFSSLLQLLLLSIFITIFRFIFFTDKLIKSLSIVLRTVGMFVSVIVVMIAMVSIFRWFPINDVRAWIGFAVSFGICGAISVGITFLKEKSENRKLDNALKHIQGRDDIR